MPGEFTRLPDIIIGYAVHLGGLGGNSHTWVDQ
ncbi:uncharacterized protein METZ01_LOCUS126595 [marine metagenome]|uniref:Uncharacterized protein n=1 Tax=marine metagenome TaxID=408172 RepID=A0A381YAV9_9ZZZZ